MTVILHRPHGPGQSSNSSKGAPRNTNYRIGLTSVSLFSLVRNYLPKSYWGVPIIKIGAKTNGMIERNSARVVCAHLPINWGDAILANDQLLVSDYEKNSLGF